MTDGADKQVSAYERWEFPAVESGRGGKARLTAAGLELVQRQAFEEAYAEGRREGFEQGYREGREAAGAELEGLRERLHALLDALADPLSSLDDVVEESLLVLATAIARQLVRRELKTDPGQVVASVREAMAALPVARREVRIYLHPDDVTLVREALALDPGASGWSIVEDPLMTRGGCQVESEDSRVDAKVESRLATVIAHVLGGERQQDEGAT